MDKFVVLGNDQLDLKKLLVFEFYKIKKIRSVKVLTLVPSLLVIFVFALSILTQHLSKNVSNPLTFSSTVGLSDSANLFASFFGLFWVASELKNGSIAFALVATNSRFTWIKSKVITSALWGMIMATLTLIVSLLCGWGLVVFNHASVGPINSGFIFQVVGLILSGGLAAAFGSAMGLIIRNLTLGNTFIAVYRLILEGTLFNFFPQLHYFFIGGAFSAITHDTTVTHLPSIPYGYFLAILWVGALLAFGNFVFSRVNLTWRES